MLKSSAKKEYQEKIKQYKKYSKKYFEDSAPMVSDQDFDSLKREILDLEKKFDFKILVDPFATQDFIPLPDGKHPEISIVPTIGKNWKLVAPSLRRPKEKFRISIKCEDKWGNPSNKVRMVFFLHSKEKIIGLPKKITFKKGQFSEIIHDLNIHKEGVYRIELKDVENKTTRELELDGVFVAIGHDPNVKFLDELVELDEKGYIKTGFTTETSTSVPGVFAAGDVADSLYRQAITAAGTGCQAAMDVERWLDH